MKDHVSPSQISTFKTCPTLWKYTALEGRRLPPSGAAHRGSSFHKATEAHNRLKVIDRVGLAADAIEDAFTQAWRNVPESDVSWDDERPNAIYDGGAKMARLYAATSALEIQPTHVEQEVLIPAVGDGVPVLCRLDLVDEQGRVIDFKTTGKAPGSDDAHNSDQLTAYAGAHTVKFGHLPSALALDFFVAPSKTRPTGLRAFQPTKRDELQVAAWRSDVAAVTSQMRHAEQTGMFPFAPSDSWKCSDKWCGFFNLCPGGAARRTTFAVPSWMSEPAAAGE